MFECAEFDRQAISDFLTEFGWTPERGLEKMLDTLHDEWCVENLSEVHESDEEDSEPVEAAAADAVASKVYEEAKALKEEIEAFQARTAVEDKKHDQEMEVMRREYETKVAFLEERFRKMREDLQESTFSDQVALKVIWLEVPDHPAVKYEVDARCPEHIVDGIIERMPLFFDAVCSKWLQQVVSRTHARPPSTLVSIIWNQTMHEYATQFCDMCFSTTPGSITVDAFGDKIIDVFQMKYALYLKSKGQGGLRTRNTGGAGKKASHKM